ncbi:hypothetical protein NDU88_003385, partial [Pleurodeles waltl]
LEGAIQVSRCKQRELWTEGRAVWWRQLAGCAGGGFSSPACSRSLACHRSVEGAV